MQAWASELTQAVTADSTGPRGAAPARSATSPAHVAMGHIEASILTTRCSSSSASTTSGLGATSRRHGNILGTRRRSPRQSLPEFDIVSGSRTRFRPDA
ncbi:hypothetical protein HBB16_03835 [Pseudonocardia sp. MCCB 268]|nr:hypothetical protein [Pseudonocardia cytotoxica]